MAASAPPERRPITDLHGVGPRQAERFGRLGVTTVADLLFHLPLRYQDRTRVLPLGSLRPGDEAVIEAEVVQAGTHDGRRRSLLARVADGTGWLTLRWFYFGPGLQRSLVPGTRGRWFGEVRTGPTGLEMVHPEAMKEGEGDALTPIYPATEGLTQPALRTLMERALPAAAELADPLAGEGDELPELATALQTIHRPPPEADTEALLEGTHPARRRLAFEELVARQIGLRRLRAAAGAHAAPPLVPTGRLTNALLASLPFNLTAAQERVAAEIRADLGEPHPMQRLVQGDVGSGKTVVAALAALQAVEAGWQVAVMAPTEILAEQHRASFQAWCEPLGLEVAWLSGRDRGDSRRAAAEAVASGRAAIVVGTHALFQEGMAFHDLGLVIIDEQHRFGVHQRLALREKGGGEGRWPHQLIMTATPIPRTLAQSAYADLDVSVIDERPPGRTPVETVAVPDSRRPEVVERVGRACAEGRQAYWVCTLIEESEASAAQAAEQTAAELGEALPTLHVGLVHGRLRPEEKEAVMAAFKAGELDLLVATTVIEVGVDVPNASLMIIENPERLGLAQLHQLRGRVGRGSAKSSCVLLYHGPLSENAGQRLAVMRESDDGFTIARHDLALRGPGEVLGTRQTGVAGLRAADLQRDADLLPAVQQRADALLERPEAAEVLERRWLPEGERYAAV